jgi:phosphatidylglycerophosphatase A
MTEGIATLFGIGHLRPAPGTWGSLAALVLALPLIWLGGIWLLALALALVIPLGLWATEGEIEATGDTDPAQVVIDEVAGQWVALIPVALGCSWVGVGPLALWPGLIAAFLAFRLFDIWKPGAVGRADQRGDALGVMADDLIAGAYAAVTVSLLAVLGHALMRIA